MHNKLYDFPLYSFSFLSDGDPGQDDQRYSIVIPQGRLVLRPALRIRGRNLSSSVVDEAITCTLSHLRLNSAGFSDHGHDEAWLASVQYWRKCMLTLEQERMHLQLEEKQATAVRQTTVQEGLELWGRASLAARLARLGKEIVPSARPPRGAVALHAGLEIVAERLQVPERMALLSDGGFTTARQARLLEVIDALRSQRLEAANRDDALRQRSDMLAVVRGALVGDLGRLCLAAPRVLPKEAARELTQARLFPGRRSKARAASAAGALAPL